MKNGIKHSMMILAVGGWMAAMATGCATVDRKVTVIEDDRSGATTIVREDAKEVNTTVLHQPVITEPAPVVASDAELK